MAATSGEVVVDGLATRVRRPRGWANQDVLYDAKRHSHTAQGLAVSTTYGGLLWCPGRWRADLPPPLAPPDPHVKKQPGHPQLRFLLTGWFPCPLRGSSVG